jgi:hypothetical protein
VPEVYSPMLALYRSSKCNEERDLVVSSEGSQLRWTAIPVYEVERGKFKDFRRRSVKSGVNVLNSHTKN